MLSYRMHIMIILINICCGFEYCWIYESTYYRNMPIVHYVGFPQLFHLSHKWEIKPSRFCLEVKCVCI